MNHLFHSIENPSVNLFTTGDTTIATVWPVHTYFSIVVL